MEFSININEPDGIQYSNMKILDLMPLILAGINDVSTSSFDAGYTKDDEELGPRISKGIVYSLYWNICFS